MSVNEESVFSSVLCATVSLDLSMHTINTLDVRVWQKFSLSKHYRGVWTTGFTKRHFRNHTSLRRLIALGRALQCTNISDMPQRSVFNKSSNCVSKTKNKVFHESHFTKGEVGFLPFCIFLFSLDTLKLLLSNYICFVVNFIFTAQSRISAASFRQSSR